MVRVGRPVVAGRWRRRRRMEAVTAVVMARGAGAPREAEAGHEGREGGQVAVVVVDALARGGGRGAVRVEGLDEVPEGHVGPVLVLGGHVGEELLRSVYIRLSTLRLSRHPR